jgi:transitional endoplasmic reticulum ATPase
MIDPTEPLRHALTFSPDNRPLRHHLASTLMSLGRFGEAELEYRELLRLEPDAVDVKVELANAYFQQEKNSPALVVVEDLLKHHDSLPRAILLHAKLLYRAGDVDRAVRQYKSAISEDPEVVDPAFEAMLGIDAEADDEVIDGRVRMHDSEESSSHDREIERPKISFDDVGGMDPLKEEIRLKIVLPLTHPELFKSYGKTAGGGILMYGPPGCGKTHLARATAGEVKANFLSIGIHDILDMWVGNSEKNLHGLFAQARRNRPCVLFFDEVDALAASRADLRQSAGRMIINQFLNELDGVKSSNEGILILAATNAPWHLDNAFRRPGRFDRVIFVPPPDVTARAGILRLLCTGKPQKDLDFDAIAKKTDQFSGADLKGMIDLAIEAKLREAAKTGKILPLTTKDILAASGQVRPTTKEWFATAKNYALYSNQGGAYDDILKYLKL